MNLLKKIFITTVSLISLANFSIFSMKKSKVPSLKTQALTQLIRNISYDKDTLENLINLIGGNKELEDVCRKELSHQAREILWKLFPPKPLPFKHGNDEITGIGFSKNENFMISSGLTSLRIWDISRIPTIKLAEEINLKEISNDISRTFYLVISPNYKYLLMGAYNAAFLFTITNLPKISLIHKFDDKVLQSAAAFTSDSNYILMGGKKDSNSMKVTLWDISNIEKIKNIYAWERPQSQNILNSIAINTNNTYALSASWGNVNLFTLPLPQPYSQPVPAAQTLQFSDLHRTEGVAFTTDGKFAAIGAFDGEAQLFDASNLPHLKSLTFFPRVADRGSLRALSFSPDNSSLALAYDKIIDIWDIRNAPNNVLMKAQLNSGNNKAWISTIKYSASNDFFAAGYYISEKKDNNGYLWKLYESHNLPIRELFLLTKINQEGLKRTLMDPYFKDIFEKLDQSKKQKIEQQDKEIVTISTEITKAH